jgi:Raf kinase inhibitor-like YbhB/YbcL family protein
MSEHATFTVTSPSFAHGEEIPARFTCEGQGTSPALRWSGLPSGTRTLALIVDDPDAPDPRAPQRTFVHWVVYDIPASADGIPDGGTPDPIPVGAHVGRNDARRTDWYPPCPPIGRHRYFFKLFALDTQLGTLSDPSKAALEKAMEGHVLARSELMVTYEKQTRR